MKKMHKVKENGDKIVNIWGTGKPKREFIFVEDLADACLFLMEHYNDIKPINIGSGNTLSIAELATAIKKTVKYQGLLNYEKSKPDGMPEKTINSNKLFSLGWSPSSQFKQSLLDTYKWYLNTHKTKEVF